MKFRLLLPLVLLLSLSLLGACGGSNEESQATHVGPQIGTNISSTSLLRKSVPFTLSNPNASYSLGSAYVARIKATSTAIYWMIPVTNVSNKTSCFVNLDSGEYRSNNGTVLDTVPVSYVAGSTRDLGNNVYTNTCLTPGQGGFFVGVTLNVNYDQIGSIVFASLLQSVASSTAPALTISPAGYSVTPNSAVSQKVSLSVHNDSSVAGVLAPSSLSILLDGDNTPLIWFYITRPTTWNGSLNPGGDGVLESTVEYEGASHNMWVNLDYGLLLTPQTVSIQSLNQPLPNAADFASVEEFDSYMLSRITEQEQLKQLSQW